MTTNLLSLTDIAKNPNIASYKIQWQNRSILFRPIVPSDKQELTTFLISLSHDTRLKWHRDSFDSKEAEEVCDAIAKYDKLRLIGIDSKQPENGILAWNEYSFGIPEGDISRYESYGISLNEKYDCRWGPCVRDDVQGKGLASLLMPATFDIARRFGKKRMILWGGVYPDNYAAVKFYKRHGFRTVGEFLNGEKKTCIDMICDL
eukprot:TRINITY_DN9533_c0_g1_i4.p1 TRINITY_DN9533_c0_g1~~TRINITY_DN9533_c0_g1_i4.p1  ORF type:complete len:204 (-),score=22.48 TRINITY_DN9533_c0_g1_i4:92-703(-)